jgi:hypothetical protein
MDADSELVKAKWLLVALVAFAVSGCYSLSELNYLVRGETTDAQITEVLDTTRGRRSGAPVRLVKYTYKEPDGTLRRQDDVMPPDWLPPGGGSTVPVRYVPGSEYSGQIVGSASRWPLLLFGVCCAAALILVWSVARQANAPPPRRTVGRSVRR